MITSNKAKSINLNFSGVFMSKEVDLQFLMKSKAYDIEHSLGMYAIDYCTLPAEAIYDIDRLTPHMQVIKNCHIYLIGLTPVIKLIDAKQENKLLTLNFIIGNETEDLKIDLPEGFNLILDEDKFFVENPNGERSWPTDIWLQEKLAYGTDLVKFEVKYIGQSYGKKGERNAIDRLMKHETLQKIALKGIPAGYRLSLLLLAIQPNNQLFTMMNPFAKNKEDSASRFNAGLEKLFGTTEQERISLYEASLIRYFYPEFNKEFKDSFPSTNLKILQDCYNKDFSGVVAEICIDELPFILFSQNVGPKHHHIAMHDLHKDDARRMFFGL